MKNKYCFIIVGPTAVGKTDFAIQLARHFNTSIISADSRQCYKELNIGVAKPSLRQLAEIKHYFISTHSIHEPVNAKMFEAYAVNCIHGIFETNNFAVMVGGTGLYVNAFCNGIDEIPATDESVKNNIISSFKLNGIEWLQNQIEKTDPVYFEHGEILNPHRLIRALEVKLSTGRSIMEFQQQQKKKHPFTIVKIGLHLQKEQLHQNIATRVDVMIQQGLMAEVMALMPYRDLNALNTVGYRELFTYVEGGYSLEEGIEKIKSNTRQYAKRQVTWFKKDKEITWINAGMPASDFIGQLNLA